MLESWTIFTDIQFLFRTVNKWVGISGDKLTSESNPKSIIQFTMQEVEKLKIISPFLQCILKLLWIIRNFEDKLNASSV